jgi:uracil-DNA glycosylase family 4
MTYWSSRIDLPVLTRVSVMVNSAIEFHPGCRLCPRLHRHLREIRRRYPRYHAAPVPPFGARDPGLLIIGLAPGLHGANATGRPFTGDAAGALLYRMLHRFGFSTGPESKDRNDGLELRGCRITNAVKCLPPGNRPVPAEVRTCNRYLRAEIARLAHGAVILALGRTAHQAVLLALDASPGRYPFAHGRLHRLPENRRLLDSYHCSRYNTNTGRLTEPMFAAVIRIARRLVSG